MVNTVQHKRGTTAQVNSYTGNVGEFIYNTTTKRIHTQDGVTAGGFPHALVSDVNLKANSSVTISAGSGLTGGGTLAANRTIALSSASIASLALADSAVQSVNGKTGASVSLTKADVGLSNVDNTSDANKPISTATQTALNAKANSSVTITAGAGLTGGGNLTANRTLALDAASIASLAKADTALQAPGGTTGQILAKNSNTTNDVSWVSSEAATAVSYGPQTLTEAQQVQARQNIQADHAYDTIAIVTAASVPAYANAIRTNGYYAAGDGGGAMYKRVASEPSHAGKIQSADGAWWEIVADVANVKMFGAKGDGVSDDYSSIMGAYGYLSAKGISILKFPATGSSYYSVSSLVFDAPIPLVLEGDGRLSSQLSFASSVVDGVIIGPATGYNHRPQLIRDVGFVAASSTDRVHLNARNCVLDIDNVSTYDGRHGFILNQCFSYSVRNCQFNGSRLEALLCQNSADAHNSEIRSNGFFGCGVATNSFAVRLEKSDSILIMQNQFEECWGGIELRGCYSVTMLANYIERGAGGPPFYFNVSSDIEARKCGSIVIEGCWFALHAATYIENVDGLTFNNNTIYYQTIGFGPGASSGINIGQNSVIEGGVIDNPPWTLITTINGWASGGNPLACNTTSHGQVSIRGVITRSSGDGNQIVGTLPIQFRPRTEKRLVVPASDGFKLCVINTGGAIYVEAGGTFSGSVYMDISFLK